MATAPASMEPTLGFPPKGSLKRFPFPRLIREVASGALTGSLYLLSDQTKKVVFFEQGQPVFVRSNVLSECLGQILAHEGLITQEQCEQTLEAIRRTGKKQGELLVEMGILSEGNLRYGLAAQLRAKLFDIFSWEDGRYQFKRDTPDLQFGVKLDASAEGVIIEAIQDQISEERARASLAGFSGKYPLTMPDSTPSADSLHLLAEERYFLSTLDGSRSVSDVLENPPEPVVPSPAAFLWGLTQAGIVEMADDAKPARAAPAVPTLGLDDADDASLAPKFEPTNVVTEYEDTPLPGELPKSPGLLGDHEDDFAGVEDSGLHARSEVSEDLIAADGGEIDETFDDSQIDLESQMELIEDDDLEFDTDFEDDDDADDDGAASDSDEAATPTNEADAALAAEAAPSVDTSGDEEDFGDLSDLDDAPALVDDAPAIIEAPANEPIEPELPELDLSEAELAEPELPELDLSEPELPELDLSEPDLAEPDLAELDVSEPNLTEPDPAEPDPAEPDLAEPAALDTTEGEPAAIEPPALVEAGEANLSEPSPEPTLPPTVAPPGSADATPADAADDDIVFEPDPIAIAEDEDEDKDADDLGLGDDDLALDLDDLDADVDLGLADADQVEADAAPTPVPAAPATADDDLDDIDLGDIDGDLALDSDLGSDLDDLDLGDLGGESNRAADAGAPVSAAAADHPGPHAAASDNALVDLGDLDAVDLGDFDDLSLDDSSGGSPAVQDADSIEPMSIEPMSIEPEPLDADAVQELAESGEVLGARRFNDAETALGETRYDEAVSLLEQAYDNGFDVAELHAMLAYARFMASGQDEATAQHAFELLDYAQNMDPSLDLVHAYRGAILQATGQSDRARESLDRALELNPYCELAMEIMDSLA